MLHESYPVRRRLSVFVVWRIVCIVVLEFKTVAILSKPPEKIKLLRKYFS
jgi:hypothetical protein